MNERLQMFQSNPQGSWDPHLYLGPAYTNKGCNSSSLPGLGGHSLPE